MVPTQKNAPLPPPHCNHRFHPCLFPVDSAQDVSGSIPESFRKSIKNLLLSFSVPFISFLCVTQAAQSAETTFFAVDKIASAQECQIIANNKSAAPVTVTIKMIGRIWPSNRTWPLQEVVAPNSIRELALLFSDRNGHPCQASIVSSSNVGDAFAAIDRHYQYRLPFRQGQIVRVTQEPNGVLSTHKDALSRYAIDFAVPKGTPILAARAGVVIEAREGFSKGRPNPAYADRTNLVSIVHADGTYAQYAHLAQNSVLVRPGERVEAGHLIARSGDTGFASGPHLHFDVRRARIRPDGTVVQESLPFDFYRQGTGKKITLRQRIRLTVD